MTTTIKVTVALVETNEKHFSVTYEQYDRDSTRSETGSGEVFLISSGSSAQVIKRYFPHLRDAWVLHLSNIDGVPLHVLENGYYYLTHLVDGKLEFGDDVVAKHFRIKESEVQALRILTKSELAQWIPAELPRWKREAEEVIAKYNLRAGKRVYEKVID